MDAKNKTKNLESGRGCVITNTMKNERTSLRADILAARDSLPPQERQRKSRAITERILALPKFAAAKNVFAYVSFRSEVGTLALIGHCLKKSIPVSVPLTVPAEHRLLPYGITDPNRDLVPGYCGILEPLTTLPLVDPASIELVVMPGSVFDLKGGRLGYGGGYYDRFLQTAAPQALRIGLAYDLQVIEAVPTKSHDQRLDYLVTETRIIQCDRLK